MRFLASREAARVASPSRALCWIAAICLGASTASPQTKSRSDRLFIDAAYESNEIWTERAQHWTSELGRGPGLVLGYGFGPRFAAYTYVSESRQRAVISDHYDIYHVDVGARLHFRTGPNTVVPFLQAGWSERLVRGTVPLSSTTRIVSGSGSGISFGGGLNVHVRPAVALEATYSMVMGSIGSYEVRGVREQVRTTSSRWRLGAVWFP